LSSIDQGIAKMREWGKAAHKKCTFSSGEKNLSGKVGNRKGVKDQKAGEVPNYLLRC